MKTSILILTFATAFNAAMLAHQTAIAAPQQKAPQKESSKDVLKAAPELSDHVYLKESVIVGGKLVRIGDFFANAGNDVAGIPVAYAPEPGERAAFDANWLYRVARAYKLNWKPLSIHDKAVVERDSIAIKREEIEEQILAALIEKNVGVTETMSVEISNRMLRFHVSSDTSAAMTVEDISYDPQTSRFTAAIAIPVNDQSAQRKRVTGRVFKVNEAPVLTRRIAVGEVIAAKDIEWIKVRANRLQNDAIANIDELIGKTPRSSLRAGIPIRLSEVRRPILVQRGSLVNIILRLPAMTLTAQGKAQEEGGEGDVVRVVNIQSNKVVEAIVTGAGTVTVQAAGQIALN